MLPPPLLPLLLLLLAVDAAIGAPAGEPLVYVTPAEVTALLPRDVWAPALPLPLVRALALPLGGGPTAGVRVGSGVRFRAASPLPLPPWLRLDALTGQLWLTAAPDFSSTGDGGVEVVVQAVQEGGRSAGRGDAATLRLRLLPAEGAGGGGGGGGGACDRPPQEWCVWRSAVLRVRENAPAGSPLGALGPPPPCRPSGNASGLPTVAHHCHAVAALLTDSSEWVRVEVSDGALQAWSTRPLDRERQPWLPLGVARHRLDVEVLDADDSPPVIINGGHLTRHEPTGLLRKGESLGTVVLQDADSPAVNRYRWRFLNDSRRLLAANCSAEAFRADADPASLKPASVMTVIRCGVSAAQDAALSRGGYGALLRLTDVGLEGDADDSAYADAEVRLIAQGPQPAAQRGAAPAASYPAAQGGAEPAVSYPRETWLLSGARPYSRVAQPEHLREVLNATGLEFQLEDVSPPVDAFNVTKDAGILYLKRPKKLEPNVTLYNVTVTWGSAGRASISVRVLEGTSQACSAPGTPQRKPCSNKQSLAACNGFCGWGTGALNYTINHLHEGRNTTPRAEVVPQGGCAWRGAEANFSTHLIAHYATCTPDVRHCPDGICDPLEEMSGMCPQDCVQLAFGGGNGGRRRGLYSCAGVGVCFGAKPDSCSCKVDAGREEPHPQTQPARATQASSSTASPSSESPVALVSASGSRASCGAVCVMAVVAGSALLLSAAAAAVYWRYRRCGRLQRERKLAAVGGTTASDYVQRATPPDARLLAHEARPPVDPQWEFPRSRLLVEKTLGEGEFGRVLRARAIDIAGVPGATTVAVKTLKEGAGTSEQQDLLSEYELLKTVSHPHVVRLLGACTSPGGPLYLIIEFAEHGSLRNYLRKSRHIEPSVLPVAPTTPHKILSFAWQICKGMTYLSDMKLVHRDLAARNILVAAGGICKVSDFGLTRDVYEDDTYLKKSKGRVPVKWMALESLMDHVYTSKSDVWSFGVVLWELVTLGASPYPGVAVHNLFHLLQAGYRMECPENCSAALYKVMRQCWQEEPSERPSFKQLTAIFENMLKDSAEYLDLNPSIVQNPGYFDSRSNSQEKLNYGGGSGDENDIAYGNLNILPTDSVNYLMSTAQSGLSRRSQLWHATEDNQKTLTNNLSEEESFSLVPTEQNSYLSPIQVHSGKGQILAYVNMSNSERSEHLQSGTTNNIMFCSSSSSCSASCSSKVTPL